MLSLLRARLDDRTTRNQRTNTPRPRFAVLVLEELERRELPSASGWVALPNDAVTPLAGTGLAAVYSPTQIRHAYGFDKLPYDGAGQTIAIIDAYDDPKVYSDLQAFDRAFGLADPPSFIKATPQGLPAANSSWAGEIALDVEWAHAIAPKANILLVEAKSASVLDLLGAVDYARNYPTVSVVSMSWGGPEFFNEASYESHFATPTNHIGGGGRVGGITFVASSGDIGAWSGPEWPSVSPDVLAVGGTTLHLSNGSYSSESGWSGSGGGYSAYHAEPAYQHSVQTTGRRSDPDVAYNGDPSTGVYVYYSYALPAGYSGWYAFGGTSAGAPQWAGLLALADQGRAASGLGSLANAQATIYSLPASDFNTISSGYNGYSATGSYNPVVGRGSPHADLVVRGLMAAGSSTLIVNDVTGATSNGVGANAIGIIAIGTPLDGDESKTSRSAVDYVSALQTFSPPFLTDTRHSDAVFSTRNDEANRRPALTQTDDLLRDVARSFTSLRPHGRTTEAEQDLIDVALFGDESSE